jgi:hypothetical protein
VTQLLDHGSHREIPSARGRRCSKHPRTPLRRGLGTSPTKAAAPRRHRRLENNQALTDLLMAPNRDPRMAASTSR